jgi:glycosyltransferase involved in cell wall biosynthesis
VHVNTERGFSGGEVQVFLLLEGLRAAGQEVMLVAPPGSASATIARQRGFPVAELGLRHPFDLWSVWRLAQLLRRAQLVHLHTGRAAWLGSVAARLARCPAVITRRMDRAVKRGPRTRFAYVHTARAVIAISPAVQRCLVAGGVPAGRIVLVPDALDPQRLLAPVGREATRRALGVGDDHLLVLTLAQLMHRKGLDVLLHAAARLRDPRLRFVIAGDGPEAASLQQLTATLQLANVVQWLGRRSDAGDLLAACDLFVLPSRAEGLGVAALEALGAARPVIGTRVGGLADLLADGVGMLVAPADAAALAAAMAQLAADAPLRQRLAAGGPARVDAGFRPEQYVARHLAIYQDVLAAASRPR